MSGSTVLDIALVVLLLAYLISGYRTGLVRSLFGILGVAVGGLLAILLVPRIAGFVDDPVLRTIATIAVVIILIGAGNLGGAIFGSLLQNRVKRPSLHRVNRILGAVVTTVIAALVMSMVAASIAALGVPQLSQAIGSSRVLATINGATPSSLQSLLAQVRSATVDRGIPEIADALGAPAEGHIPAVPTDTSVLGRAAQSVVRITGNAYACGQSQSGSGVVVSEGRVVTNAHVVAGVTNPVVEVRGGPALPSTIVYFDPVGDLAVLSVPALHLAPLPLTSTQPAGTDAVSDGYPFGGPFVSLPVGIDRVGTVSVKDIYGETTHDREVYTLSADVQEGDSGGPLLTTSGQIAGLIFARGATTAHIGYAITMQSLAPVAQQASSLSATVSSGRCTRG